MTEATATRLVVVGQGYVGLPLAMRAVEAGFDVVGFDVDAAKVGALTDGRSPVEDITDERLAAALSTGRYRATTDPADAAQPSAWLVSLAVGLIYAFAMGVDFPASNRRFSLLVPRT